MKYKDSVIRTRTEPEGGEYLSISVCYEHRKIYEKYEYKRKYKNVYLSGYACFCKKS